MHNKKLLEELHNRVEQIRSDIATLPGLSNWQIGYISGLERALKLVHECVEKPGPDISISA
jgi:hypothetical protein